MVPNKTMPVASSVVRTIKLACLLAAWLTLCATPVQVLAVGVMGTYIVNASSLYVRRDANTTSPVLATLQRNEQVQVSGAVGSFYRVTTGAGVSGYCLAQYLTKKTAVVLDPALPPDWASKYIDTGKATKYLYAQVQQDMNELVAAYGNSRVATIGTTTWGTPIKALVLGNASASQHVLVQAAIHGRECITTAVAMRQAENLLRAAKEGASVNGVKISTLLKQAEIWVVPVANPDGVALSQLGASAAPAAKRTQVLAINGNNADFSRWKANGRGVDLNRNFDYGWKIDPNYPRPAPSMYSGPGPFSEPESKALRDLTLQKRFDLTMSYHITGQMVYWYSSAQIAAQNSVNRSLAMDLNSLTGYTILPTSAQDENGGYRDWYMAKYPKPGFTIEMATGYAPVPQSQYASIWSQNRYVLLRMVWGIMPNVIKFPHK